MTQRELSERLVALCRLRGITLGTAESCTGGLIAKCVTDIAGSSAVIAGGFVTYTNEIKTRLLGVDPCIFKTHTEVSHACARAMAAGARDALGTTLAVSATGYAGPGGGSEQDPVGTVYLGIASPLGVRSERFSAPADADRDRVRTLATCRALALLWEEADRLPYTLTDEGAL